MIQKVTASPEETTALGFCLGRALQAGDVVCVNGELGTGKTHFTKGIARGLGIEREVTSPSYTILQIYEGRIPLYHFDLYRMETADELLDLGFAEFIYGQGACIVEWADKFSANMPAERLTVILEYGREAAERSIKLEAAGRRHQFLLEEMQKICTCWG